MSRFRFRLAALLALPMVCAPAAANAADGVISAADTGFMNEVAIATRPEPEEKPAPKVAAPAADKPAGPAPAAKNAMAETLRALLALKKPPGRRPGN